MQLLFLWVDDYKIFKNRGFKFTDEFDFTWSYFIDQENKEIVDIKVKTNPDYINLFPKDYLSVTGILGQNASGKTTLINLLKIFAGDLTKLTSRIVFCYRDDDETTIHTVYYSAGKKKPALNTRISSLDEKDNNPNSAKTKIIFSKPKPYKIERIKGLDEEVVYDGNNLDNVTPIFFSNSFDTHREDFYPKIANISTNYMVFESTRNFLRNYTPKPDSNTNFFNQVNPLIEFFDSELKSQMRYIVYAKRMKILDIPLPEYLMIGFNKDDFNYLKTNLKNSFLFDQTDLDRIDEQAMQHILQETNPAKRIISTIYLLAFYYALKVDLFKQAPNLRSDILPKRIHEISLSNNIFQSLKLFIQEINAFDDSRAINHLKSLYSGKLERLLEKTEFEAVEENPFRFKFQINSKLWDLLDIILGIQYLGDRPFLDYSWYGISSGQEAFLRQYSRFYSIKDSVTNPTLWIMIDEGELYFHPDWQKEYVRRILEFLPLIFPGTKIQLFLSSHSPFVACDLPKSNIIFLRRSNEDNSTDIDIKETFGSNIHTLFTSSFFLSGLLGDFAKIKIDEAIDYLNDKPQKHFKNDEELQKFIRIIGEPILRNQLQKMLDSKLLQTIHSNQTELEKRVKNLEDKNKKE